MAYAHVNQPRHFAIVSSRHYYNRRRINGQTGGPAESYMPPLAADSIWSFGKASTAIIHGRKHVRTSEARKASEKANRERRRDRVIEWEKIIASETLPGAAPNRSQTFRGLRRNDDVCSTFKKLEPASVPKAMRRCCFLSR